MALITNSTGAFVNGRPTVIGSNSISILYQGSHTFTLDNFTTETNPVYLDPEEDDLLHIVITSLLDGLGTLKLSGVPVILGQIIISNDIAAGNLVYDADAFGPTVGYSSVFEFDIADTGSTTLSGLTTGIFTMTILGKINLPPNNVGDNTINKLHGASHVFTVDNFTIETTPAYSDPEDDAADILKILTLPATGNLKYNGVNVIVNQEISFSDIAAKLFTYVPDIGITTAQTLTFGIEIADEGSGNFTS